MGSSLTTNFFALTEVHFPLLFNWLRKPHVREHWPDDLTDDEIRQKYLGHINSGWVFPFVIQLEQRPIGYIQCYQAWKENNNWWPDAQEGTYGMDLFIGELDCLGKGLGSKIVAQFMEHISATHHVKQWIIDVDKNNQRAIRCYEKAGFTTAGDIVTPDGLAILMQRNL